MTAFESRDDSLEPSQFEGSLKCLVIVDREHFCPACLEEVTVHGTRSRIVQAGTDAPIMIMDDSVSAVDVKTEETILNNINEKRKGKTTIIIASRVSTVSHLDKILVLKEGRVEAFDTPKRLLEISPTYQKMVYLQQLENEL